MKIRTFFSILATGVGFFLVSGNFAESFSVPIVCWKPELGWNCNTMQTLIHFVFLTGCFLIWICLAALLVTVGAEGAFRYQQKERGVTREQFYGQFLVKFFYIQGKHHVLVSGIRSSQRWISCSWIRF